MLTSLTLIRSDSVAGLFRESIPLPLRLEIVRRVSDCYRGAIDHCATDDDGTRRDHIPYERRRRIETAMRTLPLSDAFSYVGVQSRPNSRNSSHHIMISSGKFALTFSKTDSFDELPRPSVFRSDYASSVQLGLFDSNEDLPQMEAHRAGTSLIYGVVCHGPDDIDSSRPGYVNVHFPSAAERTPVLAPRVDLLSEFYQSFASDRPSVVSVPAAKPKLRVVKPHEEQSS